MSCLGAPDTVEPCAGIRPVVEGGAAAPRATRSPADDKAGVAAVLEALRSIVDSGEARPTSPWS
ncbi:MAG: hypothetical protein ACLSVD_15825 [Eggerthellaceae bacterium]